MRPSIVVAAALTAALVLTAGDPAGQAATAPATQQYAEGAAGIGDPYYPGRRQSRLRRAQLPRLARVLPQREVDRATAVIHAVATSRLTSFHFDFEHLRVSHLTVDGRRTTWRRVGAHELVVTPAHAIRNGRRSWLGWPTTAS